MPVIRSGGKGKRRRWVLVASNVQSLTEVKWDVKKAMLMRLEADVLILGEVWFGKATVNPDVVGYHTVWGRAAGRGKMLVLWICRVLGEQHKKVRDKRNSLVVLLHWRPRKCVTSATRWWSCCTGVTCNT